MLHKILNESVSSINTTDKELGQSELTLEQIEDYIKNYFKGKDEQWQLKDFEKKVMSLLNTKDLINLCKMPSFLELVCSMLHYNCCHLYTSALERIEENNFYSHLLLFLCRIYLNKFKFTEEYLNEFKDIRVDAGKMPDNSVYRFCKYELGFLEYFAFSLLVRNKDALPTYEAEQYLVKQSARLQRKNDELLLLPKAQLNLGVLKSDNEELFYFKYTVFKYYFAARYLTHCLQQKYQPDSKLSSFSHKWEGEKDIVEYIKENSKNVYHQPVWDFVEEMLQSNRDQVTLVKFNHFIGKVWINPDTFSQLKIKIENLPQGYIFDLLRKSPNEIQIVYSTSTESSKDKSFTLIGRLQVLFEIFIEKNKLEHLIKLTSPEDSFAELNIYSEYPFVMDAIARSLKEVSGQRLLHIPLTHSFFSGASNKSEDKQDLNTENEKANTISCCIQ